MERRIGEWFVFGVLQYFETARFVEPGRLEPRIRDRNRQPSQFYASAKLILLVCGLTYGDLEFAGFISVCTVNAKHIALVTVLPLIEGAREPDAGLDGQDATRPSQFSLGCCPLHNKFRPNLSGVFHLSVPLQRLYQD